MGKGSRARKKAAARQQHAMEEDQPEGQWQSGVSAETGEDFIGMDTSDFADKLKAQRPSMKVQQAKRGNRTKAQKRRKSAQLEKALAFGGKLESKGSRAGSSTKARKQAKGLWGKDEEGGAQ